MAIRRRGPNVPKKRKTVTEEILPDAPEMGTVFAPEDDLLQRAAEDLGASLSTIKVYQVPKNGKPEYLTEFASDDSDSIVAEVARRFGGGAYLARFYGEDGLIQRAPVRFNVAASVKPVGDDDDGDEKGDFKSRVLEKLLTKAIDGGGGNNPAAITAAIVQSATAQSAAMMQLLMPMIQRMMEASKPATLPTELMAEMFHAGVEMANAKDDPSPMGLVERFAGILERVQARPASPAPAPAVRPVATAAEPARIESPSPEGEKKVPGWLKVLQPYVNDLVQAATDSVPPALVAATIIDRSPATADWLVAQPATFVEALLDAVPALKPHEAWTREVFDALRDADSGDEDGDEGGDGDTKVAE